MGDSTGDRPDVISRRQALKKVAIGGTVLGGAAWIAPSIITTAVAQAAGSNNPQVQGTTIVNNPTNPTEPNDGPGTNVLGTQVGKLPATGINVKPIVATGVGLIAGGAVIAAMADRVPVDQPTSEED